MKLKKFSVLTAILSLGLIALDQAAKLAALRWLSPRHTVRVLGNFVTLRLAFNRGAFLSIGHDLPNILRLVLLIVFPLIVMVVATVFIARDSRRGRLELFALSMLVAGGLGNIIDRTFRIEVIDFLNFGIGSLRTGIMNLADLFIAAFLVLIIISALRDEGARASLAQGGGEPKAEPNPAAPAQTPQTDRVDSGQDAIADGDSGSSQP